jgi:hypothetical protein
LLKVDYLSVAGGEPLLKLLPHGLLKGVGAQDDCGGIKRLQFLRMDNRYARKRLPWRLVIKYGPGHGQIGGLCLFEQVSREFARAINDIGCMPGCQLINDKQAVLYVSFRWHNSIQLLPQGGAKAIQVGLFKGGWHIRKIGQRGL